MSASTSNIPDLNINTLTKEKLNIVLQVKSRKNLQIANHVFTYFFLKKRAKQLQAAGEKEDGKNEFSQLMNLLRLLQQQQTQAFNYLQQQQQQQQQQTTSQPQTPLAPATPNQTAGTDQQQLQIQLLQQHLLQQQQQQQQQQAVNTAIGTRKIYIVHCNHRMCFVNLFN
jgi:hypothetical protein